MDWARILAFVTGMVDQECWLGMNIWPLKIASSKPSWRRGFRFRLIPSGHRRTYGECPLSGVKRTCAGHRRMSANDSKRTLNPIGHALQLSQHS